MIWANDGEIIYKCLVMLIEIGENFSRFLLSYYIIIQFAHHLKLFADFSLEN